MKAHLHIEGMSCENCVKHVTDALVGVRGVKSANVSLHDKAATVDFDPAQANADTLIAAVHDDGYEASLGDVPS